MTRRRYWAVVYEPRDGCEASHLYIGVHHPDCYREQIVCMTDSLAAARMAMGRRGRAHGGYIEDTMTDKRATVTPR